MSGRSDPLFAPVKLPEEIGPHLPWGPKRAPAVPYPPSPGGLRSRVQVVYRLSDGAILGAVHQSREIRPSHLGLADADHAVALIPERYWSRFGSSATFISEHIGATAHLDGKGHLRLGLPASPLDRPRREGLRASLAEDLSAVERGAVGAFPQVVHVSTSPATATGSGFQTLHTFAVPASMLTTGRILEARYRVRRTTGVGSGDYRLTLGTTALATVSTILDASVSAVGTIAVPDVDEQTGHLALAGSVDAGVATEDADTSLNLVFAVDLAMDTDVFTLDSAVILLYQA